MQHAGLYVDTIIVYNSGPLIFAGLAFPLPNTNPKRSFNTAVLTIPFAITEPRLNLGI